MRSRLTCSKLAIAIGVALLAAWPSQALAHDGVGGDEFAAANWMLVAALVTVVLGVLMGIWAFRAGQFTNVEESKYTMLELSDDYDAIMVDFDKREQAAREEHAIEADAISKGEVHDPPTAQAGHASTTARV